MTERRELDPLPELSDELARLDSELAELRIRERPSFGPELEAELRRRVGERPLRRRPGAGALAAGLTGLALVTLATDPARASLARLLAPSDPGPEVTSTEAGAPSAEREAMLPEAPETPRRPAPPTAVPVVDHFESAGGTLPEVKDEEGLRSLLARHYPAALRQSGVGGVVLLRLWVDSTGAVDFAEVREGSGVAALDRAALAAAADLHFEPARQFGAPLGTWVELPLLFEPAPPGLPLPRLPPEPSLAGPAFDIPPPWAGDVVVRAPVPLEAHAMLRSALGGTEADVEARFGPIEALLEGETPPGASPFRWRAEAADALETARARDPDNPAPYLALGRIRRKQGLRDHARALFEEGIVRAGRGGRPLSPLLLADLHFERGLLLRDAWRAARDLGHVSADALEPGACPRAGARGELDGTVSAESLIALSYLCPGAFERTMTEGFRPASPEPWERLDMIRALEAAVTANAAHVGANVELLLARAEEGRWYDVLDGARRFAWASGGHAYALLLGGIALQRLGRSEEAADEFHAALEGLSEEERVRLTDVGPLMDRRAGRAFATLSGSERDDALARFWRGLDPLLITEVNEREVEHLARAVYAHLRFGPEEPDAAEVWIRYGRPATVRAVGEPGGLRTEFWDYGEGPDFAFRTPSVSGRLDLTPEARTYLEELRDVSPHRYGTDGRGVFSLPAQVARFREGAGVELHVYTSVPASLVPETVDAVELGVYLVGASGSVREVERRRAPARGEPLAFRVPADDGSERVVVEVYEPTTQRAAVLRAPARGDVPGPRAGISDLLVLSSTAPPSAEVSRHDAWLEPRVDATWLPAGVHALLFELYDLPADGGPYRLRAELRSAGAARSALVPVRPAGETDFRAEWSRSLSGGEAVVTEHLTVDLQGAPPGPHTLHVVVELPGGREVRSVLPVTIWREGSAPLRVGLESIDGTL